MYVSFIVHSTSANNIIFIRINTRSKHVNDQLLLTRVVTKKAVSQLRLMMKKRKNI